MIAGLILLTVGLVSIIRPEIILRYRIWVAKKLYGADYKPSKRTFQVQKVFGLAFVILGILAITKVI